MFIPMNCVTDQWVYKINNHRFRYLPRRKEGIVEYDYAKNQALPDHFPHRLDGSPPKLWVAWIYRPNLSGEVKWIKNDVEFLFGKDWKVRLNIHINLTCAGAIFAFKREI